MGMNEDVTAYLEQGRPWQTAVAQQLRETVHATIPDVEEAIQYGKPHFLKSGKHVAVIHVAKAKLSFMLFNASEIEAEKGFLRSMGNGDRKTIDLPEGQEIDTARIAALVQQAAAGL